MLLPSVYQSSRGFGVPHPQFSLHGLQFFNFLLDRIDRLWDNAENGFEDRIPVCNL